MSYNQDYHWEGQTKKEIDDLEVTNLGGELYLQSQIATGYVRSLPNTIVEEFAKEGYMTSNVTIKDLIVDLKPKYYSPTFRTWKVYVSYTVNFDSDRPIIESPIAPIIIAILVKIFEVLVTLVLGYLAIVYAMDVLNDVLTSMVTTSHTIIRYDEAGNIISKETLTVASAMGIGVLAIIFIVILFLMGVFSSRK